ncbi:MAG: hypothetical protein K8R89_04440, partial [Anaerolineae bacterium]|nr:hypothetical protein [Anaerolineae bacterium]
MPLVGVREREPLAVPELLANVEPPAETNVDGGAGETPEWFKSLPSFEEATSRLRFPDSVDVKRPHAERDTASSSPRSSAPPAVSPSSPQITRKPVAPESSASQSQRMRVYTQTEEFTSGRQPPPISLQDLRRVHVGEPKVDTPAVQRLPVEDTEPRRLDGDTAEEQSLPEAAAVSERATLSAPAVQRLPAEGTEPRSLDGDTADEQSLPEAAVVSERVTPSAPAVQRLPAEGPEPRSLNGDTTEEQSLPETAGERVMPALPAVQRLPAEGAEPGSLDGDTTEEQSLPETAGERVMPA